MSDHRHIDGPMRPRLPGPQTKFSGSTSGRLHAVSAYGFSAPSTRVRLLDWIDYLGLSATVHSYAGFADNRPQRLLRSPLSVLAAEWQIRTTNAPVERLILSREASPFSRGELEEKLLREARHGVFDLDDAIFLDAQGPRSLTNPGHKSLRSASAADVVLAGNDYLADWASSHASDVRVIPSCVNPSDYAKKQSWDIEESPKIVWLGSPSTERYLAGIANALLEVSRRTGARLKVISTDRQNGELAALDPVFDRVPWSHRTFAAELSTADVAIAPLNDTRFARGKCAYKLLQYAATGLPMVGTPIGANAIALERFHGLAAITADDWVDSLLQLLNESSAQRGARANKAFKAVHHHYSFEAWADSWSEAVLNDR